MLIHVASDIHFEFMGPKAEAAFWAALEEKVVQHKPAALIIAGDIGSLVGGADRLLGRFDRFLDLYRDQVLYTPGNHEFFGTSIADGHRVLCQYARAYFGFHPILPGQGYTLDGKNVRGGTLWYPDCGDELSKSRFIDYGRIADSEPEIENQHQAFLAQPLGDIVVSHHFPTDESIAPEFKHAGNNEFFCAYIDAHLEKVAKPKLWIHGHTHTPVDYVSRHGFRVYCNPHGYPNEGANPNFFERLRVEI